MPTRDAPHQTIGKLVGLAVFGGDALSSIAYAPQETLVILAAAGPQAYGYAFWIALVITVLLAIVTLSYQQTLHAYPNGGGAYTVALENLGEIPAQVAGVALLIDYVLLAAVAISSGVAQIASAIPVLYDHRVALALLMLGLIMIANLRGVKESGTLFAVPTYFFLIMTALVVVIGLWRYGSGDLGVVFDPPAVQLLHGVQPLTFFLLLRAFANGTTALTGVECISNGVTAFREPRTRNASQTMLWMSGILGVLFVAMTFLLGRIGAVPAETETVVSQLARTVYTDRGLPYLATLAGTTIILILATNTAFADFPRLTALIGGQGYLPRYFTYRGSRLVFSYGIIALAVIAGLLIVLFNASVTALIPLWAVGVFISFTLSQTGMARHWWRAGHASTPAAGRETGWLWKLIVNGVGAAVTAIVAVIFAVTKFMDGAWIILLVLPSLVAVFLAIRRHYNHVAQDLSLDFFGQPAKTQRHRVLLPIGGIHRGTLAALDYARNLSTDVTAVYVATEPHERELIERKWLYWGDGVRLVIIDTPFRAYLEPLLEYIDLLVAQQQPNERLTIVVPQFITPRAWHNLLHAQTAFWLRFSLLGKHGIVVTEVPYQVDRPRRR